MRIPLIDNDSDPMRWQPVDFVEKIPDLTEKERKLILGENAARFLKL